MIIRANQRVLVLGGTGSVGGAVAEVLRQRGHEVICLARSEQSEARLRAANFSTMRGDIRNPDPWIHCGDQFDAVVHAAITWSDDMARVDQQLTAKLLQAFATTDAKKTIIYTNGCWAYGETADNIATEDTPFDTPPDFAWTIEVTRQVTENRNVRGMVIFPAMVYERDGGVLEPMVEDARRRENIRIVRDEKVRWPLVHRTDLAQLYALMLERGEQGASYNGAGIVSVEVGDIARALAKRHGKPLELITMSVEQAVREFGSWAEGYGIDQQMSSAKAIKELGWAPKHTDILTELS